jgi:polyhydroxyalkanoate synthesis regulator phasin
MKEPESHTLRLLQEIRGAIQTVDNKVDALDQKLTDRIDNLARMVVGESVLGRFAVADVDKRLEALETRVSALEERR